MQFRELEVTRMDGKVIAEMRKKKCINQEELAHMLSINTATLSRWENGHFEPKASMIKKLCECLGCSETELLNGSQDNRIELVVSWSWEEMKKGEIDMNEEKFKLILDVDGKVGIQGAGKITSMEAIEEFLGRIRNELVIALDTQIRRGVVQPVTQEA